MDWTYKESLYSFHADLGEYVYIIPKGHNIKQNNEILSRIYSSMGVDSSELVLMHHDLTRPVGEVISISGPSSQDPEEKEYEQREVEETAEGGEKENQEDRGSESEDDDEGESDDDELTITPDGQAALNDSLFKLDVLVRDVDVPRISIGVLPRTEREMVSIQPYTNINGLSMDQFVNCFAANPFPKHDLKIIEERSLAIVKEKILGRAEILSVFDESVRY